MQYNDKIPSVLDVDLISAETDGVSCVTPSDNLTLVHLSCLSEAPCWTEPGAPACQWLSGIAPSPSETPADKSENHSRVGSGYQSRADLSQSIVKVDQTLVRAAHHPVLAQSLNHLKFHDG